MANDFSNIAPTMYQTFLTRLGSRVSNWTQFVSPVTANTPFLQRGDFYGTTVFGAQTAGADPTAEDLSSSKSVVASAAYEKYHKVTEKEILDNPEIRTQLPLAVADAAAWTIANLLWTAVTTLDTTAHPDAGGDYDAGAKFADSFTNPVTQSNLLTAALSESALASAKQILAGYKNKAGLPWGASLVNSDLCLVVPPALEKTAYDLTTRSAKPGSTLGSTAYDGIPVVVMPTASDDNDWWLFHKPTSPVKMWIRKAPSFRITLLPDTGHWAFYSSLEAASVLEAWEGGFVMGKVA